MKTVSPSITTGVMIEDAAIAGLCRGLKFIALIPLLLTAFIPLASLLFTTYLGPIKGSWVDESLSQVLTRKYGHTVRIKNASIIRWSDVSFNSIRVYSKDKSLLVTAASGRIYLKNFQLGRHPRFESEIVLKDVEFLKEYYKNAKELRPWIYLMQKPIRVQDLKIGIAQGSDTTVVEILKSRSDQIVLSGCMVFHNKTIFKDSLSISLPPLKMLQMII